MKIIDVKIKYYFLASNYLLHSIINHKLGVPGLREN